MNHPRSRFLVFAASLLLFIAPALLAQTAPAKPAAKTVDRFERTKEHIDALLKQRLKPVLLPAVLPNPFQAPSVTTATSVVNNAGPGTPFSPDQVIALPPEPEKPLTDDDEILAHYAGTLKFGGQMMVGGQPHLIINSSPYKEGSLIQVKGRDDVTYYFKIIKIAPNELTLGYNAAVFTFPLK